MDEMRRRLARRARETNDPEDIWRYVAALERSYGAPPQPRGVNLIQLLHLDLMRAAGYDEVADDLLDHKDIWHSAIMQSAHYTRVDQGPDWNSTYVPTVMPLLGLRDLGQGMWNVATLWILVKEGQDDTIVELAEKWGADEVDWYTPGEAISSMYFFGLMGGTPQGKLLRVWWD